MEEPARSGPSPEAWREFRQQLITSGLKLTTDHSSDDAAEPSQRQIVAPGNEALLREQNMKLYEEYLAGNWAHESPVEEGGLLVRMPLEAQLTHFIRGGEGNGAVLANELQLRLRKEISSLDDKDAEEERLESWLSNTPYCYRLCERFVTEQLEKLTTQARQGHLTIDVHSLSGTLLQLYQRTSEEWQQVVLVLSNAGGSGASGVALNRPLHGRLNLQFAKLLLKQTGEADALAPAFLDAFGTKACVYLGGPSQQEAGAILVHGVHSLEGAVEVAPGTGIYTGGERAAIEAVSKGDASPLDFRWFVGRHKGLVTSDGSWRAVACARPIALKQCLLLPKPLWHEVMELCGGECATLSRLEILKREDLADADGGEEDE